MGSDFSSFKTLTVHDHVSVSGLGRPACTDSPSVLALTSKNPSL
jgi:hypothetical protein